jgi:hypothetical protein
MENKEQEKEKNKDSLEERAARFADILSQRNYYTDQDLIIKADTEKVEEAKKSYKSLFKK